MIRIESDDAQKILFYNTQQNLDDFIQIDFDSEIGEYFLFSSFFDLVFQLYTVYKMQLQDVDADLDYDAKFHLYNVDNGDHIHQWQW